MTASPIAAALLGAVRRSRALALFTLPPLCALALGVSSAQAEPPPEVTAAVEGVDSRLAALVAGSDRIMVVELGAVDTVYTDCKLFTGYRYDVVDVLVGQAPPVQERWLGDVLYVNRKEEDHCAATGYAMDVEGLDIDGVVDARNRIILFYTRDRHFAALSTASLPLVLEALNAID